MIQKTNQIEFLGQRDHGCSGFELLIPRRNVFWILPKACLQNLHGIVFLAEHCKLAI